ncbi:MAG: CsgG/HfaB family protein [Myxococcota bacterium]
MFRSFFLMFSLLLPIAASAADDRVAVLYFDNQGNEQLEPLKVGLAQMLITDLQGTPDVTVVERQRVQQILDELELGHSGMVDKKTAAKVGKLLGAEWIVMGGYFELAGTLRIDARLVKVETGEIVHAHGVNGTAPEFLSLEKRLANELKAHLAGNPSPEAKEGGASATRGGDANTALVQHDPEAVEAAVAYSEGLIFLDGKDKVRARESFEKAVASDDNLAAAKAELAALDL